MSRRRFGLRAYVSRPWWCRWPPSRMFKALAWAKLNRRGR